MTDNIINELRQKLLSIATEFDKWLEKMEQEYNIPKNEIQALIKQFLQ